MGVQAVMVEVGFPMLYEPFLTSQGQSYSQFVTFYQQVAADVRAAGLQLVVENNILLAGDAQSGWLVAPFYATLNWTQYQQARAQTAAVIAQTLQPDYLIVLQEPDTEAANTGQTDVNTASGAAALVSQMLTSVQQAGVPNLKVGAGVGTWLKAYADFIQSFDALPLDFIDMHIYPVFGASFLPNALTIATTAAAAGKPVSMSECWLNKSVDAKSTPSEVRARNPFSFWAPLDAYFIQTMEKLANYTQMAFLSPTGVEYFSAYLPYNSETANLTPQEILDQEESQANVNMIAGTYTFTGMRYYHSMVRPPDRITPSVPLNLAGVSGASSTVSLSWNAASDNVGVAVYPVVRDGVQVGTTIDTFFKDVGLTEGTTYNYMIQAFDLAGNASPFTASVPVTTREVTPPTTPTNLTATVVSHVEIDLAWSASTDNIGIRLYRIFQGIARDALSQVANSQGSVTSYHAYHLSPGTTYYFAVEAEDNNGNVSQMSNIVAATTPQ
jgi:chitodextrinase